MERFTIKDIENLSQIKAHTLRIWEQRYTFFTAKRKDSQHRYYDGHDLQVLLQVAFLYHGGMKISHIAALDEAGRLAAIERIQQRGGIAEQEVLSLVQSAAAFDERRLRGQLDRLVAQKGLEAAVLDVFFPFLQRIGHLWLTNHVIPAQEHFSSYLIQNKIISETEQLPPQEPSRAPIVLLTPRGEHHELPLLFINYLLRREGWAVTYLGTGVSVPDLPPSVLGRGNYIYVHLITNLSGQSADDYFESVCKAFPEKTFVVSGSAIQGMQRQFRNLVLLRTDDAILQFIRKGLPG
ncbi:MerR family transcriptional regulator [Flaviaesturariibacter flavus]|uniref:MerR family transcriptional regulator n=1 Tax=Flaviaesturariibacter flavus TaxID=2502780 RepID=A0A4R1BNR5_9BACT|nr:MerR family transcriptional regulator [Flaviaesturariibacter flavus]TCJ19194.1 MerR family transcriptional regulator [Flaviaesturariibacter flavus]